YTAQQRGGVLVAPRQRPDLRDRQLAHVVDCIDQDTEGGLLTGRERKHALAVGDAFVRTTERTAEVEDTQEVAAPWRQADHGRPRARQQREVTQCEDLQQAGELDRVTFPAEPEDRDLDRLTRIFLLLASGEMRSTHLEQRALPLVLRHQRSPRCAHLARPRLSCRSAADSA